MTFTPATDLTIPTRAAGDPDPSADFNKVKAAVAELRGAGLALSTDSPKFSDLLSLYNATSANTRNLRNGIAKVRAGAGSTGILFVGDSITSGGPNAPFQANSFPTRLRTLIAADQAVTAEEGVVVLNETATQEPRVTVGTGWATDAAAGVGLSYSAGASATGNLVFAFASGGNTARIYYATNSGLGTIHASVNGGTVQNVSTNAAEGIGFATFTGLTVGSAATITITPPTVGVVFITGVETYNTAANTVRVTRAGSSGANATLWTSTTGYAAQKAAVAMGYAAPVAVGVCLGLNDWQQLRTTSAFQTDITTIVTAYQSSTRDVFIVVPPPPPTIGSALASAWPGFVTALYAVSDAKGIPLVDITSRWVSDTTSSTLKADTLHPNPTGYADIAQAVAALVLPR